MGLSIHLLAKRGDAPAVEALPRKRTDRKALLNAADETGWTPLMHAVRSTNADVALRFAGRRGEARRH